MYKLRHRRAETPQTRIGVYISQSLADRARKVLHAKNISISSVVEKSLFEALNKIEKKDSK
jgi:post-segregation antitoxin (ccd killing protein)